MNKEITRRLAQSEYARLRTAAKQLTEFLSILPTMHLKSCFDTHMEVRNALDAIHKRMQVVKKQLRY